MRHRRQTWWLFTLLSACSTVHTPPPEPMFPPAPSMPPVVVPSFDEQSIVGGTVVPGSYRDVLATVESMPAAATNRSLQNLPKRFSRLFAQSDSSSDVTVSSASTSASPPEAHPEMIDVEATLHLVVENVVTAAASVRSLARSEGAMITEDVVDEAKTTSARFTIRVPSAKADSLLAACEKLGQARSRQVNARDIGKEFHDAQLLLANLEVAMHRYEEILKGASQISDVLALEKELGRLRSQIETVKGTMLWMQDRVSRSTLHVYLVSPRTDDPDEVLIGRAKIYPGVRFSYLADFRGDDSSNNYYGLGLSLRFNRDISLDVDGLVRSGSDSSQRKLDVLLATMGGEVFSEFMGNGRRRFFNPYLGWRLGYARFEKHSEFAFACSVGLEILKTRPVSIDLAARLYGLIGKSAHMAVEPVLSANVAF
jgi:hypothetical protein